MSSPSDPDLLRRFVAHRAEDAFAELVRRHLPLVYRAALRQVGDDHRAQEVTQAVFTALAWKARSLTRHTTLVGWLHTATRYAAHDIRRSERRRRIWEQEASRMHDILSSATASPDWEKLRPVLDEALGELSERDRTAVLLRFFSGQTFAAIGAALNVPENTARMRVDRALDKLHALLARRGLTSTSAALATVLAQQASGATAPSALAATVTQAALASTTAGLSGVTATVTTGYVKAQLTLGLAAVVALGIAWQQNSLARREEANAASLSQQIAVESAKVAALQKNRAAARPMRNDAPKSPPSATASPAPRPQTPAPKSQLEEIRDNYLRRRAVAWSNPEYQRLAFERSKWDANQSYRPLFQRLQFSPERIAQFETLVAEHQAALSEILAAAYAEAIAAPDPAVTRLQATEREKLATRLHELLGPADYTEYERYEQILNLRTGIADPLASLLYASAAPFTGEQAETLTQILARHASLSSEGRYDSDTIDWDAAYREAQIVLTPTQFDGLRAIRARADWMQVLAGNLSPLVHAATPTTPAK